MCTSSACVGGNFLRCVTSVWTSASLHRWHLSWLLILSDNNTTNHFNTDITESLISSSIKGDVWILLEHKEKLNRCGSIRRSWHLSKLSSFLFHQQQIRDTVSHYVNACKYDITGNFRCTIFCGLSWQHLLRAAKGNAKAWRHSWCSISHGSQFFSIKSIYHLLS